MKILSGKEEVYRDWYNKNLDNYVVLHMLRVGLK